MATLPDPISLFSLDRNSSTALHRQLYERLRVAIKSGGLAGRRLPSTRGMAEALSVSRKTVIRAYELLVREHLISPRRGAGFYPARIDLSEWPLPFGRTESDAAARRSVIIEAARLQILDLGVSRLTMLSISRRAALSPSTVYSVFGSIKAVIAAVAHESFASFRIAMAAVHAFPDAAATLAAIGEGYVRFAREHPQTFEVLFRHVYAPPGAPGASSDAHDSPYGYLCARIRLALGGMDEQAARESCCFFCATAHGLAVLGASPSRQRRHTESLERAALRRAAEAAVRR